MMRVCVVFEVSLIELLDGLLWWHRLFQDLGWTIKRSFSVV
jgi:hypothetical protein